MTIHTLVAGALALVLVAPVFAGEGRDTTRIIKSLGLQSGNQKVIEALNVLEQEKFLDRVGEALAEEGAASQTAAEGMSATASSEPAAASEAPAAPGGLSEDSCKQIATQAALPRIRKDMGNANAGVGIAYVKKKGEGYQVQLMPESAGIVCFFVSYYVTMDGAGKVLSVK
jgi:hypothetical protein